jgi:transcriptional regulator with GAF, ATPase, and Fis domain
MDGGPLSKQAFRRPEPVGDDRPADSPYGTMAQELIEVYVRQICLTDHICLKKALLRLERDIILHVLARTNGNQHEAAELLGLKANTLNYKMQRLGISPVHRYVAEDLPKPH